ncbi:hypothetical protein [Lysobacter gummosus]|uniref:hypothetical protein n=1 Tax=Lysobacter gummosus TaxID=262324 RepID=UPI00362CF22D
MDSSGLRGAACAPASEDGPATGSRPKLGSYDSAVNLCHAGCVFCGAGFTFPMWAGW